MGRGIRTVQACAAAACAVFSSCVSAQAPLAAQAAIERAQATGVLAGLQRAVSTPLEVVWLRTAAEVEAWSNAGLAGATVGRTGWRYIFGGNAQFAPAPNEVARLVVSSLRLPKAPLTTGTLALTGSGRLFIVSSEMPDRAAPAQMALVLAAGSTLQVSDTASPGLQIEIKAPERQPLLLGNLASANVRRMLALLVKPSAISASAASVKDGKVALRTGAELELAAIVDGGAEAPTAIAAAPTPEQPAPPIIVAAAPMFEPPAPPVVVTPAPISEPPQEIAQSVEVAATFDTPVPPAEVPAPVAAAADAAPAEQEFRQDPPLVVASVEPLVAAPSPKEPAVVTAPPVSAVEERPPAVAVAAVPVAPAEEAPVAPPVETPIAIAAAAGAPAPVARAEPVPAKLEVAAVRAKPVIAIIEASPPPAQTAQQAASIERMRAEIEAEIARDRERLAHQRALAAPAKRFVLGV